MEKRTMIALLITIVLLFFFQMYFTPKQQPEQQAPQGKSEQQGQTKTDQSVQPKAGDGTQQVKKESPKPSEVKTTQRFLAETPLLKISFSDLGGGIDSVQLTQYKVKV
jgi:YidC/Oxa1 family membrane protein insertase